MSRAGGVEYSVLPGYLQLQKKQETAGRRARNIIGVFSESWPELLDIQVKTYKNRHPAIGRIPVFLSVI